MYFLKSVYGKRKEKIDIRHEIAKSIERISSEKRWEKVETPLIQKSDSNQMNKCNKKSLIKQAATSSNKTKRWVPCNSYLYLKAVKNLPENIHCYDISKNYKALAVSTKSKTIYIFNLSKILFDNDGQAQNHEYVSFTTESTPNKIAVSEKANFIAVTFVNRIGIYERKGKKYELKSTLTGEHQQEILDMLINEDKKALMTIGADDEKF